VAPVFLVAGLLASCGTERSALELDTHAVPPAELAALVNVRALALRSLTGKGSLTFDSPEAAGSAYFTMALKKPDSLIVRLQGPFGMDIGFLFLSRERFVMYNGMENRVVSGSTNADAIRGVIPIDLTYEQILNAFSGTFVVHNAPSTMIRYAIEEGQFLLSYVSGSDTTTYWIDPATELVTRYLIRTGDGQTLLDAAVSRIEEHDGIAAPRRIQLRLPGRRVSIYYTTLVLNAADPSFAYSVPENAHTTDR
jgi:hypothetical protein